MNKKRTIVNVADCQPQVQPRTQSIQELAAEALAARRAADAKIEKLVKFAVRTLEILEEDTDWNSETLEGISAAAYEIGLAGTHKGFFRRIK